MYAVLEECAVGGTTFSCGTPLLGVVVADEDAVLLDVPLPPDAVSPLPPPPEKYEVLSQGGVLLE